MASASVTENINAAIRQMRKHDKWLWILGDDHVWPNDCLLNLLNTLEEHPEIDILVPLVVKRNPPWHLVIFHDAGTYSPDTVHANGGDASGYPQWKPYTWDEVPPCGVFEIDAAGSAGMLIKKEVLDKIGDPWFASTDGVFLNEDVMFCTKAKEAGFKIYATADMTMGHLGIFNVRPLYKQDDNGVGRWGALAEFSSPEEQYRHLFMPDVESGQHPSTVSGR